MSSAATLAPTPRGPGSDRGIVAALAFTMLLASLSTSIANVGLPSLARDFHTGIQHVQWVVLAYLLATTSLIVGAGRLGDILGRRRMVLVGLCVFTVASALCSLAPGLEFLVAARFLQGLGAALMLSLSSALVADRLPKAHIGRAMGLLGAMSAVGTAIGPSFGGVLIELLGWSAVFAVGVPLGAIGMVLVWRLLPGDGRFEVSQSPFDLTGTFLLAGALSAYALTLTLGATAGVPIRAFLAMTAVTLLGLFVRSQKRSKAPLVRLQLFADPRLSAGFASSALVATVVMTTLVVGPFYLSGVLALGSEQVGAAMSVGPAVAALTAMPAGRLVDRIGAARTVLVGLGLAGVGAALLCLVPATFGLPGYIAPLAVLTCGYAMFQTANAAAVMQSTDPAQRGVVSAFLGLSRNLGLITGASAMGAIFASASASGPAAGMHLTFAVATSFVLAALALSVATTRAARRLGAH